MKVTFYRSALNSNEKLYKSSYESINYPGIFDEALVIKDAINQFQTNNNVVNWQEIAEFYEIS